MTVVHKVTTEYKNGDEVTIDFTSDESKLLHGEHGYVPQFATPPGDNSIPPYVVETLPLDLQGADMDALATLMQSIHDLQVQAARFFANPFEQAPVWYHQRLEGESGERRALVRAIGVTSTRSWFDRPTSDRSRLADVVVTIERHPYYEATSPISISTMYNYYFDPFDILNGASLSGNVPGRIGRVRFRCSIEHLAKFWGGFISERRRGDLSAFINKWELEDGANDTDAADVSDSTASGGALVRVTPSAESWDGVWNKALQIGLLDVETIGNDLSPQFGENLWLLRAKVSAGTWWVKLRWLYATADPTHEDASDVEEGFSDGPIVEISSTSWQNYELGVMPIPLHDVKAMLALESNTFSITYRIDVYALRADGSGTLDLDVLYPIPLDAGYFHMDSSQLNVSSFNPEGFCIGMSPNDRFYLTWGYAIAEETVPFDQAGFYIPVGNSRLIHVFQGADESDIDAADDTWLVVEDLDYYPRWIGLRGSE